MNHTLATEYIRNDHPEGYLSLLSVNKMQHDQAVSTSTLIFHRPPQRRLSVPLRLCCSPHTPRCCHPSGTAAAARHCEPGRCSCPLLLLQALALPSLVASTFLSLKSWFYPLMPALGRSFYLLTHFYMVASTHWCFFPSDQVKYSCLIFWWWPDCIATKPLVLFVRFQIICTLEIDQEFGRNSKPDCQLYLWKIDMNSTWISLWRGTSVSQCCHVCVSLGNEIILWELSWPIKQQGCSCWKTVWKCNVSLFCRLFANAFSSTTSCIIELSLA